MPKLKETLELWWSDTSQKIAVAMMEQNLANSAFYSFNNVYNHDDGERGRNNFYSQNPTNLMLPTPVTHFTYVLQ